MSSISWQHLGIIGQLGVEIFDVEDKVPRLVLAKMTLKDFQTSWGVPYLDSTRRTEARDPYIKFSREAKPTKGRPP